MKFEREVGLKSKRKLFEQLYLPLNEQDKDNKTPTVLSLTYGEIEFTTFAALLQSLEPKPDDIFYDLGSGHGKACVTAALVFNFKKCIGIELLPERHERAIQIQSQSPELVQQRLSFHRNDFLQIPLADATIIFINATGFFNEKWTEVSNHLEQVKKGCLLIVTSKKLPLSSFTLLRSTLIDMAYGPAHISIYEKC